LLTQAADLTLAAWKAAALLLARRRRRRAAAARRAAERERDDDGTPRAQPTLEDAAASLEASTESIDEIGCRLIGLSLAPLGLGLPLYTLLASPHRSWRSWLLDALAKVRARASPRAASARPLLPRSPIRAAGAPARAPPPLTFRFQSARAMLPARSLARRACTSSALCR
jgi:hypothetical protein